jgi:hypothetical protein
MGKGVAEVAEMLSFPELFLILRRDAKRKAADFRLMAIAQILAASAPWNKDAAKRANDFISALDEPETVAPEQSTGELTRMLMQAGIPVREE